MSHDFAPHDTAADNAATTLRVIPVLDLLGGHVVRGVAGRRELYRPIESPLASSAPAAMAEALADRFGFRRAYVADLDAIAGRPFDWQACRAIVASLPELLLDAGIADATAAAKLVAACRGFPGRVRYVVGLESLRSFQMLKQILDLCGPSQVVFSLDLHEGRPLHSGDDFRGREPAEIAAAAVELGVEEMIVLDLAGVGVGNGVPTLDLCRELAAGHRRLRLISGGGVRGGDDLTAVAAAGCRGALVASALHDGRLTAAEVAAWEATDADRAQ